MKVETREWGTVEVPDEAIVHLPEGLLGFEDLHRFVFIDVEEFRPFMWFLSVDDPEVGFAVADPYYFHAGPYDVNLTEADENTLDLEEGDTIAIFVIVTIADGGRQITANLKGPMVFNTRNRLAKQVVVYGSSFSVRQPMLSRRVVPIHAAIAQGPGRP